jgi:hypothetical protein
LAPGPLGSVVGDPDRHRGWLLCPSSPYRRLPAGRGLRPRVFSAHRPLPQLQVQDSVMGRRPIADIAYIQTGTGSLQQAFFTTWSDLVPIQTGAPAQIRAADRPSGTGTPAVLPSRYMASVVHTGLLRRSSRCSVITQRARVQQRPSQQPPPFLHVPPRALWLECGPVEKKKKSCPIPAESHVAGCMPAASGEQRGHLAAPGRQMKWGGCCKGPLASDIGSFSHGRAAQTLGAQDPIA